MVLGRTGDGESSQYSLQQNHDTGTKQYASDLIEIAGVRYTLAVIQALCIILAAMGNGVVMYFILKYRKQRRNATAFFILNLAFCDLIGACLQQPMRLINILLPFAKPNVDMNNMSAIYCKISGFNMTFIASSGFLTVVAIAVERLIFICYPLRAKPILTHRNIMVTILGIWGVAFATSLPLPIEFTYITTAHYKHANLTLCVQDILSRYSQGGSGYHIFLFVVYFVFPVIVITTCYCRIFFVLHSTVSSVEDQSLVSRRVASARKRLATMMVFIAVIFIALHGPHFVTYFMMACGLGIPHNPVFTVVLLDTLPVLNAALNPFIYSAHSRTFFKRKMVNFMGGQYEDSTVYRKDSGTGTRLTSASGSRKRTSKVEEDAILESLRKASSATETTSLRTTESGRTSGDVSRAESFRTEHDSPSLRSESFRSAASGEADSLRRDEYMNNTRDSSFSQDERLPLSQIQEETEV